MKTFIAIVTLIAILTGKLMAQNGITDTSSITPPWAAHSSNFLLALFQTDTSTINKFLPNGVYALSNENGLATTGLEIYGTDSTNGAPIYKAAFIYVEIMGHQSESNMPGHWIIWGKTNHKLLAQSLKTNFGFKYDGKTRQWTYCTIKSTMAQYRPRCQNRRYKH